MSLQRRIWIGVFLITGAVGVRTDGLIQYTL